MQTAFFIGPGAPLSSICFRLFSSLQLRDGTLIYSNGALDLMGPVRQNIPLPPAITDFQKSVEGGI